MEETKFRVGDKVRFKTWQEMEEEFGLDEDGDIDVYVSFTSEMENDLDKERVYTVSGIDGPIVHLKENTKYHYSTDMFHLVQSDDKVTELYRDIKVLSKYLGMSRNNVNVSLNNYSLENIYRIFLEILFIDEIDFNVSAIHLTEWITLKELRSAIERDSFENKKAVYFYNSEEIVEDITEHTNVLITKDDENDPETLKKVLNFLSPDSPYKDLLLKADFSALAEILDEKERTFKEEERKRKNKNAVEELTEKFQKVAIAKAEDNVDAIKRRLDDLKERYHTALVSLKEKQKELLWVTYSQGSEELNDFASILNRDETLYRIEADSYFHVYFRIIQPLLFVDSESYELYRKKGIIKQNCDYYKTSLRIIDAIFRREVTLIIDQGFYFDVDNFKCKMDNCLGDGEFGVPNPHIKRYDCWGDNYPRIIRALEDLDYVTAYTQAKSAIAGLNIDDGAVMDEFYKYLSHKGSYTKIKCIKIPETGELMTIGEAEEYLQAKDKEEGRSEEN